MRGEEFGRFPWGADAWKVSFVICLALEGRWWFRWFHFLFDSSHHQLEGKNGITNVFCVSYSIYISMTYLFTLFSALYIGYGGGAGILASTTHFIDLLRSRHVKC